MLEEPAGFARLGLVIVDEQHRFGVLQRKRLMEKGAAPDVLVMTATPIPRTLALTLYGDLDVSVIDQMPPGRTPIETRWSAPEHLPGVWDFVGREVKKGRQAYVVYPVIEQSKSNEAQLSLKSAIVEYERLQKSVFPRIRVGLLHGRMKSEEKEQVMEAFRRGERAGSRIHDGDRGRRGCAERHRHGDRTCRAFWPVATSPTARAHRTRRRKRARVF